ncbi:MAG: ECF-type sigma factor [Planctomycetota bacterium]
MSSAEEEITGILRAPLSGDAATPHQALLDAVYSQLKRIAEQRMRGERDDHTLNATALVHEAFLRLSEGSEVQWDSRGHFFAAAAESMRRILIDHARQRGAVKRGGGKRRHVPIDVADLAEHGTGAEALELEDAIVALAAEDARAADVVRLRFYAGLNVDETAATLEISPRTVAREWSFARARLFQLLDWELPPEEEPGS